MQANWHFHSIQLQNAVAVSMHQVQQQVGAVSMALAGQQGATTITTMAAHPQAVQVIQQPMSNQYHLQQLYNAQGTPLIMPGTNLALHPAAGLNPSSIQVMNWNLSIGLPSVWKSFFQMATRRQRSPTF